MAALTSLRVIPSSVPSQSRAQAPTLRPKRLSLGFVGLGVSEPPASSLFKLLKIGWPDPPYKRLTQCQGGITSVESTLELNNSDTLSSSGALLLLFGEMGLSEEETEILLKKNPDINSASLESIRSQIRSLQSLGLERAQIYYVITKRPQILTAGEVGSFVRFLRDDLENRVKPVVITRLLAHTKPSLLDGFAAKVQLLSQHGIPQEKITHVLNGVNLSKAICKRSEKDIRGMLTLLSRYGGLLGVIRRPNILNYDLETQLIPKIEYLKNLSGGDEDATAQVIRRLPAVVLYSAEHMEGQVEFLRSFAGLSYEEIFRILLIFPNLMSASKERKIRPRINFLKQCGFDSGDIYRFLIKSPLFLGLSFERNLAYKLAMLVKIGYAYRTKDLAIAMGAVSRTSCENLQKVIELYLRYGLSCEDIMTMSQKHPQILQYNPSSLEEKMDYLVEGMGREVGELLAFPAYLGYNLDKRIKHRYEVKKKTIGEDLSINKLLTVSVERFSKTKKKFTLPKAI